MKVKLSVDTKELDAALAKIEKVGDDCRKPLEQSLIYMGKKVDMQFKKGRDPYGENWKPLKDSTLSRRRKSTDKSKQSRAHNILMNDGHLRNSFRVDPPGENLIYDIDKQYAEYGTKTPYAKYHQFGTRNPDGSARIPKRQIVGVSDKDVRKFERIFSDWVFQEIQ